MLTVLPDGYTVRVWGDLHAHPFAYGAQVLDDGTNSRLADAIEVLRAIYAAPQPSLYLCTGDVFHQRGLLPTRALNRVVETFSALGRSVETIAVAGNHDLESRAGGESALRVLARAARFVLAEEEPRLVRPHGGGPVVLALPYRDRLDDTYLLRLQDRLLVAAAEAREAGLPLLIIAHNGFAPVAGSSPFPGEDCYTAAAFACLREAVPHVCLFGHWHAFSGYGDDRATLALYDEPKTGQQVAELPACAYLNVGAPMQHGWGDAGQVRGWCDLIWSGAAWLLVRTPSQAPRFLDAGTAGRPCDLVRARSGDEAEAARARGAHVVEVLPPPPPEAAVRSDLSLEDSEEVSLDRFLLPRVADEEARARVARLGRALLAESR